MMKHANDVFDVAQFWTDVEKYRIRHDISILDLSHLAMVDPSQLRYSLSYPKSLSLRWACIFAKVCDLSLDSYVK